MNISLKKHLKNADCCAIILKRITALFVLNSYSTVKTKQNNDRTVLKYNDTGLKAEI